MSTFSFDEAGFETRQIHAGQVADPTTGARALPLIRQLRISSAILNMPLIYLV